MRGTLPTNQCCPPRSIHGVVAPLQEYHDPDLACIERVANTLSEPVQDPCSPPPPEDGESHCFLVRPLLCMPAPHLLIFCGGAMSLTASLRLNSLTIIFLFKPGPQPPGLAPPPFSPPLPSIAIPLCSKVLQPLPTKTGPKGGEGFLMGPVGSPPLPSPPPLLRPQLLSRGWNGPCTLSWLEVLSLVSSPYLKIWVSIFHGNLGITFILLAQALFCSRPATTA